MKSLVDIGITKADFHTNDKVSVQGTLEIYKGNLQIVPKKVSDIKFIEK
ncbi:MAG: hypothetical protein HYW22_01705 [Candidatus Aenigmarchaeota archaeon]|nr:hypothetical protein [Candidatus Aenigmarchaeota archaeon]